MMTMYTNTTILALILTWFVIFLLFKVTVGFLLQYFSVLVFPGEFARHIRLNWPVEQGESDGELDGTLLIPGKQGTNQILT